MASCPSALMQQQALAQQQAQDASTAPNAVWGQWNAVYVVSSGAITSQQAQYVTGGIGSCNAVTLSANAYNNVAWGAWNQGYAGAANAGLCANQMLANQRPGIIIPETAIQREQRLRAQERQQAEVLALQENRRLAQVKAEKLLLANLDSDQGAEFRKTRQFVVRSADGERCYRVEYGTAGNIRLLDKSGKAVAKFCIHPHVCLPVEDVMLCQKLLLETDEKEFLRIANRTEFAA